MDTRDVVFLIPLVAMFAFLFWYAKRQFASHAKITALNERILDINERSLLITDQAIRLQEENNRLTAELIEVLRTKSP